MNSFFLFCLPSGLSFIYTEISPNFILYILQRVILCIIVNDFLSKKKKKDKKADIINSKTSFPFVQKHASSSFITTPQNKFEVGEKDSGSNRHKALGKTTSSMWLEGPTQNLPLWFIYEMSMMVIPLGSSRRLFPYVTLTICYARCRNLLK